jgi:hypothetical protein
MAISRFRSTYHTNVTSFTVTAGSHLHANVVKNSLIPSLLDLDSLELRRLRQDLILVYKIVFRLVDVNSNDYFKMNADSVTRVYIL